jgi:nitronate monooxygenase
MPLPGQLEGRLALPAIAAPMFLVSGPDLVLACCKAGIVGSFPALNQRTSDGFDAWLTEIETKLDASDAPYGVNLIVHHTNPRVEADLAICERHRVPIVITSLGAVASLVERVHGYGGLVFHDVTNIRHAQKAAEAGVDGLILVSAGAGGHAGVINPFALTAEVRAFFKGTIILAGCIADGAEIAAAEIIGADLAYLGTRFIATRESMAKPEYKAMLSASAAKDIVYTPAISGVPASFLRQSLVDAGLDPDTLTDKPDINMGKELDPEVRAWKNIWSAGQGVGSIHDSPSVAELVARLKAEYRAALTKTSGRLTGLAAE